MTNEFSPAQKRVVDDLLLYKGSFIRAAVTPFGCEWCYTFMRPIGGFYATVRNGQMVRLKGTPIEEYKLPYHKAQETIKCLIRKKVLVPAVPDEEFAIQFALGTMDYRVYTLAEEYGGA